MDGNNQKGNNEEKINKKDLGIMVVGKGTNVLCCHGKEACRRCEMILLSAVKTLAGAWFKVLGRAWSCERAPAQGEQPRRAGAADRLK